MLPRRILIRSFSRASIIGRNNYSSSAETHLPLRHIIWNDLWGWATEKTLLKSFEVGRGLDLFADKDSKVLISSSLQASLEAILSPADSEHYTVIVGANGTGKSTAVRKVLSSLKDTKGVYFNCPPNHGLFATELSKLLNHKDEVDFHIGMKRWIERSNKPISDTSHEQMESFSKLGNTLVTVARQFHAKHKRPMVLVIDSIDVIARENPKFLGLLQDYARDCADMGILRVVFISDDGTALPLLKSRSSAWSRCMKPVFEISELSDEDAVDYLVQRGVSKEVAVQAVQTVTGGLFTLLNDFISYQDMGKQLEDMVTDLDNQVGTTLQDIGIMWSHEVFQHLVTNKTIKSDVIHDMNVSKELRQQLIVNNILASHANGTYSFSNRHVEVWFKKAFALRQEQEQLVKEQIAQEQHKLAQEQHKLAQEKLIKGKLAQEQLAKDKAKNEQVETIAVKPKKKVAVKKVKTADAV